MLLTAALAVLVFALTAESAPGDIMTDVDDISLADLDRVPQARWTALGGKRVFFGHQSVGANILEGVGEIAGARPGLALPPILDAHIGQNRHPLGKIEAFAQAVRDAGPSPYDLAFMKLCYVDIDRETDVATLFATYRDAMRKLAAEVPATRLLHCTIPLCATRVDWKSRLKRMLGMEVWGDVSNLRRCQYNELMRAEYGAAGTLIDIARAESQLPDGNSVRWKTDGKEHECLATCYTTDGGHLNAVGRRAVARLLLLRLQEVVGVR